MRVLDLLHIQQLRVPHDQHRLFIPDPKRLQPAERLQQIRCHLRQRYLYVGLKLWHEIRWRQLRSCIRIQPLPQLWDALILQRKPDRMRMTSKPREQLRTRLQGRKQVKRRDGSSASVRLSRRRISRYHQRWLARLLDHTRRRDADYPAMPIFAIDDQAIRLTQL